MTCGRPILSLHGLSRIGARLPFDCRQCLAAGSCLVVVGAFAVLSFALRVDSVGLSPDSLVYLRMSRDLRGETWFPPAFPLLLRITDCDVRPAERAVYLNAVLLGFTVYTLCAWLLWKGLRSWLVLPFGLFISWTYPFVVVFRWLWSEPLCLFLLAIWLALLDVAITLKNRRWLIVSAFVLALACLTRYVAVAFIGVALIALGLWFRPRSWRFVMLYALSAALPIALWIGRNELLYHTLIGRETKSLAAVSLPPLSELHRLNQTAGRWAWPLTASLYSRHVAAVGPFVWAAIVVWVVLELRALRRGYDSGRFLILSALLYFLCVLIVRCTAYDSVPFDVRMLSPAYMLLVLAAFVRIHGWLEAWRWKRRAITDGRGS